MCLSTQITYSSIAPSPFVPPDTETYTVLHYEEWGVRIAACMQISSLKNFSEYTLPSEW